MEPLFVYIMLPILTITLVNDAFQDYYSKEEIFAISLLLIGTVYHLRIKKEILEVPFFQTFNTNGPIGQIEKASPSTT